MPGSGWAGVGAVQFERRVRVVEGDLSAPSLGLTPWQLDALADDVDAVCHAGAVVNWVLPYRALRAANVESTRDLLAFASRRCVPFHFVSSLSVCYSTLAPADVDERFDALPALGGLHFGYAQTKAIAEALVREAGARGLPITIYRPSFISGHSASGAYNADDILARTVSGCVRMGAAPDLDWALDCVPVDTAARDIVRLSDRRGVVHLAHSRPRHWRECVLWMRMYGYELSLIPYHAWLRQLDRDTSLDRSHPLAPLRSFFLSRPSDAHGLTLPELMLRTGVVRRSRRAQLAAEPALDASLLQRYFDAFVAGGDLEPATRTGCASLDGDPQLDAAFFAQAIEHPVTSASCGRRLSDHSIVSELTAWSSGRPTGLFHYRLQLAGSSDDVRDVIVKIKSSDGRTIAVGESLARLCDARLGEAYAKWRQRIGLVSAHVRELAIYRQSDPRFVRHAPRTLGVTADPAAETWMLVLERIADATLQDSVDRPELWTTAHLERAIDGVAALHAIWLGRERELRSQPWIGYVQNAADAAEMSDLWRALSAHAAPRFAAWADPAIGSIQRRLIADVERWWHPLETLPRTLIHNDFNPRNICLRGRPDDLALCAYDWELATIGIPQHDLAELLCFVLPPVTTQEAVQHFVEHHRVSLERAAGVALDRSEWQLGFHAALYDLMLNRLPMYALVHRIRPQSFLPRVVRTWRRIYEICR
jgi:thioester reductase-like protein